MVENRYSLTGRLSGGSALLSDVAFNGLGGDVAGSGDEITSGPHGRHPFKVSVGLTEAAGRISLKPVHDLIWGEAGRRVDEQVHVIRHDL